MTENDIKKLSRTDLLELLIAQAEECEGLKQKLSQAEAKLEDRRLVFDDCGSIAEASLRINGIFQLAQKTADEYLENVKDYTETREAVFKRHEDAARIAAARIISDAERKSNAMIEETTKKCEEMVRVAKKESEKYWDSVSSRIENQIKQQNDGVDSYEG